MGTRGPAPKRAAERAGHRSKADQPDVIRPRTRVEVPPAETTWNLQATRWYNALKRSGHSRFLEPSDWEYARILAGLLTDELARPSGVRAVMMATILDGMSELGTTESSRRRMRIEVERPTTPAPGRSKAAVTALDDYRAAFRPG